MKTPCDNSLKTRIDEFIEHESRSLSMEIITPEYVYRMWGGNVPFEEIRNCFEIIPTIY